MDEPRVMIEATGHRQRLLPQYGRADVFLYYYDCHRPSLRLSTVDQSSVDSQELNRFFAKF